MEPIQYLEVPDSERSAVKQLGAWWDPEARRWFVTMGDSRARFARWIPEGALVENDRYRD